MLLKNWALVLDDDRGMLKLACLMLDELGWQTHAALDADRALQLLQSDSAVEFVLSDVVLRGQMSGYAFATIARRCRPQIAIIMTSGSHAVHEHPDWRDDFYFLPKPYGLAELSNAIERVRTVRAL